MGCVAIASSAPARPRARSAAADGAAAEAEDRGAQADAVVAERVPVALQDPPLPAELDAYAAGGHTGRLDPPRQPRSFRDEPCDAGVDRVDLRAQQRDQL